MGTAIQWIRSVIFIVLMYLGLLFVGIFYTPITFFNREFALVGVQHFCRYVIWLARVVVGLKSEVRGPIPEGDVIVASKHQSFFDILLISAAVPRLKFIMKKEIKWTPVVGYYGWALGCIAVDRGKRGAAIKKMVADVLAGRSKPSQLIIFPQGTRVAAGVKQPYKIGIGVLYKETGQRVIPTATNVGVFWPRHGIMRKPGTAVIEFLPAIEPGLKTSDFMGKLEEVIEEGSDRLMLEAGFDLEAHRGKD